MARFERSSALFDEAGRLVEWDRGFEIEFEAARPLIARGVPYRDLLRKVYLDDPVAQKNAALRFKSIDQIIEARLNRVGRDNSFEYLDLHGQIIRVQELVTPAGAIVRVATDATEERRGRVALDEARRNGQVAVMEAPAWMRREPDGHVVMCPMTDEIRMLFGFAEEWAQADQLHVYSRFERTEEELRHAARAMEESARTMVPFSSEMRVRGSDDVLRWIRTTMAPVREPNGAILWTGVMQNVTHEKMIEDRLELLRSAVVHLLDGILIFETDETREPRSEILYANPAVERIAGFVTGNSIGQAGSIIGHYDQAGDLPRRIAAALQSGDRSGIEFQILNADKKPIWIEARVAILQHISEHCFRWIMVIRDIEEFKRARNELVRAKEMAESADRAKSQFLATMSHELRTPLNAVIGFSEILRNEAFGPLGNQLYREYATDINAAGTQLLKIVNEVLDMSRVERLQVELDEREFDLDAVVRSAVGEAANQAAEAGVALSVQLQPGSPRLCADELRVGQVLCHLISNAIKFSDRGGQVRVKTGMRGDGSVAVSVEDGGKGMTEEEIAIVLRPFGQLEGALTRKHEGIGLGLPLADGLMRLHGGALEFMSEPGAGTTVTAVFPRDRVVTRPAPASAHSR